MQQELKELIEKTSGNNLHLKVAELLKKAGWEVDLSSYYYDDTANKPREIDIVAYKKIEIIEKHETYNRILETFRAFLFVECKNFTDQVAFRMCPSEGNEKAIVVEKMDKLNLLLNGLGVDHHYMRSKSVGKLSDTVQRNQGALFDTLTQPVKSLVFFKQHSPIKGLYYPVVIYSGINGIYPIIGKQDLDKLQPRKELIAELNYSYRSVIDGKLRSNCFFIDFVHVSNISDFLEKVSVEIGLVKRYLSKRLEERKS